MYANYLIRSLSIILLSFCVNTICWGQGLIVYSVGNEIYMMRPDDKKPTLIFDELAGFSPSPDGYFIADIGRNDNRLDILYIRHLHNGKKIRSVKLKVNSIWSPSWSPDGRWLVYAGTEFEGIIRGDVHSEIHLVSPDGNHHRKIHEQIGKRPVGFVWTSDSQSVYYNLAATDRRIIYELDISGKQQPKKHTPFHKDAGLFSRYPTYSFSPNGREIAYTSLHDGIYVGNVDGTNHRKVVNKNNLLHYFQVDWSPNGRHLVYVASRTRESHGLYLYSFVTKKVRPLITSLDQLPGQPYWAEDYLAIESADKMTSTWGKIKKKTTQ